jgi:hypothetical protein
MATISSWKNDTFGIIKPRKTLTRVLNKEEIALQASDKLKEYMENMRQKY